MSAVRWILWFISNWIPSTPENITFIVGTQKYKGTSKSMKNGIKRHVYFDSRKLLKRKCLTRQLGHPLGCLHPVSWCQGSSSSTSFSSSFLLFWEAAQDDLSAWVSLMLLWDQIESLASVWPSPNCWRHQGEWMNKVLSVSLLPFKYLIKHYYLSFWKFLNWNHKWSG